jgi:ATP-binding cassette, subfamily A (ABC1), member 3
VNSGFSGGDISKVIESVTNFVSALGKSATILSNELQLLDICHQTASGWNDCFGATVFHSSPTECPSSS